MRRTIRVILWTVFFLISLPSIAFTGLTIWAFHPMMPVGRGIDGLPHEDQVAYLILTDQIHSNEMLRSERENGGSLFVAIEGEKCRGPGPELLDALSKSWATSGIELVPLDCDANSNNLVYVSKDYGGPLGGYRCGGLCGQGDHYRVLTIFGPIVVVRVGGFLN